MTEVKLNIGGTARHDGQAFVDAWRRAERGESFEDRGFSFESWDALASVMSSKRLKLLRHVHDRPAGSIMELAKALGRQYRRVREDVSILTEAGLLDRSQGGVRVSADRIQTTIDL